MPHRSKSGSAMLLVELYDQSLEEHESPPMKLTVLGETWRSSSGCAYTPSSSVDCTNFQGRRLIIGEDSDPA
eukprot:247790-Amphidinium_carterae.1